ncbi:hypothetical protein ATCC90586_009251 [Pythium insidiosum]|nr:hypothetical protein ATCC90586_009251 [Pythium insidiosum]
MAEPQPRDGDALPLPAGRPVCLIQGGADGLRVAPDGLALLERLREPVAVVCLAGQYRTGKSFFLNQLARSSSSGFRVGPTTESCTRGIWLWDPEPAVRTARGERVLFMDTEGIAATDNDESYDAKIFSLGLLLSSLFVFNTMGVIDETAIDRLYLVSELTKHVCISSNGSPAAASSLSLSADDDANDDADALLDSGADAMAESRALAPHFPPFVWLLRDFMLDMRGPTGEPLTPNEYLEKSLELRDGASRRHEERNRIRASIRVLFARRECLTLVRPVTDELQLRHAAELGDGELRAEFVAQMQAIRGRILSTVAPKQLFGKVMDGPKLAYLVQCYTDTMNSGSIPDIKAAWAYVSDATCQSAMLSAMELYDARMEAVRYADDGDDDGEALSALSNGARPLVSQQDFEKRHKEAQDEALLVFKSQSVEGSTRAACFQKLKSHIQKQKTALIAALQKRSTALCEQLLTALKAELLVSPIESGAWDESFIAGLGVTQLAASIRELERRYEESAQGPAQRTALFHFLRHDVVQLVEALVHRLSTRHCDLRRDWEATVERLEHSKDAMDAQFQLQLQEKSMEIQRLEDAKAHSEEKEQMLNARIDALSTQVDEKTVEIQLIDEKRRKQKTALEELEQRAASVTSELERCKMQLQHTEDKLQQREDELHVTRQESRAQLEATRDNHQREKEDWIQRLADVTAEKSTLQKSLKQRDHELQQSAMSMEMVKKTNEMLQRQLEEEHTARKTKEAECARLRELHAGVETRLEESLSRQATLEDELQRERLRLTQRLTLFEQQLGRAEADRDVEAVLRDCVTEVVRLSEVEKTSTVSEERNVLQERLGELYLKISTLPEFYQREIFCSPDPTPNFFDALTQ